MDERSEPEHDDGFAPSRLATGSIWGLLGQILTFASAFVATPFVIRLLGTERYATYALVQLLLTYLAVSDVGMGLASTRFAAAARSRGDDEEEAAVLWTSLAVACAPTIAVGGLLVFAAPVIVELLAVPWLLRPEAAVALALSSGVLVARLLVAVASTVSFVRLRFGPYTLIWGGTAIIQSLGLPVVLWLSPTLETAVALVTVTTLVAGALHAAVAIRLLPAIRRTGPRRSLVRPLLAYGAVSAATVLVETAIGSGERLLLARLAPIVAVGYFTVAFTIARLPSALPAAVGTVLLPAFARLHAAAAATELPRLYWSGTRLLALALLPPTAALVAVGGPMLHVWAGAEFAREGAAALAVLSVAGLADGVSYVPRVHLSAIGRPDRILRYHLLNVGPYLVASGLLILWLGVVGAAIAWSVRAIVETLQAFLAVGDLEPSLRPRLPERWPALVTCSLPLVAAAGVGLATPGDLAVSLAALALGMLGYGVLALRIAVLPQERAQLVRVLRSVVLR